MFNPSNMFYITEVSKLGFWNTDVSHNRSFPASQFLVPKSWCRNWPRNLVIDDLLVIYRDFCGFNGIYWWFNDGWLLTGLTPKRIYITGFSTEERPRCLVNFFKNSSVPVSSEKRKYLRRTRRTRSCNEGICKHHLTHICNQISNILLIYLKGYTRSKMRNPSKTKHVLQGRCVSSSHVIAFAVSTSAHFSWIKKPIQHVYGVGSCYLMAIMQNNLNDMYWLVVSTPLKNISQLGWLFPVYAK